MAVCCNSNGIHKNGNLDKKILEFQRTSILPQELQKWWKWSLAGKNTAKLKISSTFYRYRNIF